MTQEEILQQRKAVIAEAKTWLGTPFQHSQSVKGAGTDCVHMPAACYDVALAVQIKIPYYSPQWHLHQTGPDGKHEELYLQGLIREGFVEISDGQADVEPFDPNAFVDARKEPGDLVIVQLGYTFCHSGIIAKWPKVIQAESKPYGAGSVIVANVDANWYFTARPRKYFSWGKWH